MEFACEHRYLKLNALFLYMTISKVLSDKHTRDMLCVAIFYSLDNQNQVSEEELRIYNPKPFSVITTENLTHLRSVQQHNLYCIVFAYWNTEWWLMVTGLSPKALAVTHICHGPIEYNAEGLVCYQLFYGTLSTTEAVQCWMRWGGCGIIAQ